MKSKLPSKFSKSPKRVSVVSRRYNKSYDIVRETTEDDFSNEEKTRIVIEGQSSALSIKEVCDREGINPILFDKWSKELIKRRVSFSDLKVRNRNSYNQDYRFNIVIEGKSGQTSVAEICRREMISQEVFLEWSREFSIISKKAHSLGDNYIIRVELNRNLILNKSDSNVLDYIQNYIELGAEDLHIQKKKTELFETESRKKVYSVVCLDKINDLRRINKYFESVNRSMEDGGIFIGCLETFQSRKKRLRITRIPVLNSLYFFLEFLFKRIMPKLSITKKYYFDFTKGNDRLLSKAEGLGRLVSCGFKIMDFKSVNGLIYFVVKKDKKPIYDSNPSYGPIYGMPRIGKNGKMFKVYKFRTMHPYSEYLQDYIVNVNGYSNTGKPADDFRIPVWGKFMRRIWLDELPQLFNVLKGEMKLVGVRPVSARYFQDIPKEMQNLRLTQKPGCIPPYVSLNREGSVMSVLQSEKDYLVDKISSPFSTDTKYFIKAIYNIVFQHKRSA